MSERPMYYDRMGFPLPSGDVLEWARMFESKEQVIKQTRHKEKGREFMLSTIWLGLDHGFGEEPPLIFETMALEFKPRWNEVVATGHDWFWQERYSTENEALAARDPWRVVTTYRPDSLRVLLEAVFGPLPD